MERAGSLRRGYVGAHHLLVLCFACGCTGSVGDAGNGGSTGSPPPSSNGGKGGAPNVPGAGAPSAGGATAIPPGGGGTSAGAGAPGAGAPSGGSSPTACTNTVPPTGLVLLPDYQFSNAIRGLLGEAAVSPQAPDSSDKTFTQKGLVVNAPLVDTRVNWAGVAAADVGARLAVATGCAENGTDACAETFIRSFAAKAWRRPVVAAEVTDLLAVYTVGKSTSFRRGVELAVHAILSAPSFGYRTEFGVPSAAGQVTLTPHEVASELSFFLADQGPDPELMAAADAGTLSDPAEIRRQVERLVKTTAVQTSLTQTLMAAWNLANLFGATKPNFPEYTPLLQSSMFRETELFLNDVFWTTSSPVAVALTSPKTFVNASLAAFYGITYPGPSGSTEFFPVELPATQRSGLLTQPSFLAGRARTDNTSVVARGLFVRGALLCLPKIQSPPAELSNKIEEQLAADLSERERSQLRTSDPNCAGCHVRFDAFGLLFENYDPIGKYRTELEGQAIDSAVDVSALGSSIQGVIPNAVEFAKRAAASPEFKGCLTQQLISYASGDERFNQDSCEVRQAIQKLPAAEPTLGQIVAEVAASPALMVRSTEVSP